jgi:tRNA(adenine34) deaminase
MSDLLKTHRKWMNAAIREAERALDAGEVPVGAVVVRQEQIVGRGHNMVERLVDPTAHAELIAITAACTTLQSKQLDGCTLYVTLEPCSMCAGASVLSRLERMVFGTFDAKAGAASTLYNIPQDTRLNHRVEIISGVEEERCSGLLQDFFRARRAVATEKERASWPPEEA